jgi:hypothetical protein
VSSILCGWGAAEQACKLNPDLPLWFTPAWMNAIAELHQLTPKVLIASKKDNPLAFLPVYEKRFITLKKACNPVLSYYSPLHFIIPERKLANRELLLEYEITTAAGAFLKAGFKRVLLNLNPSTADIRGFRDAGLSAAPQYTFIKDLNTGFEVHKNEMTTLRKAEKQGYTFDAEYNPESLLELVYGMYERKRHPFRIRREALAVLIHKLHVAGLIAQYNIREGAGIVSSILILKDRGETCYAWLTGSETETMKNGASVLLFRELFRALQTEYRYLDLCGGNSYGPSRLKAALGAELKLFFQLSL